MQALSAQALRGAVVGKAMSDPAFLEALRKDALAAIESRFGKQPYNIRVIFEQPNDVTLLLPHKTEQLAKVIDRAVADTGDRTPTKGQFEARVVQRAWNDPAFLAQLQNDPRGTLDAALKAYGSGVPADKTVRFRQEQPGECIILIPSGIGEGQLTDAELESVAGGEIVTIVGAVAGGIVVVIATEYFCS